MNMEKFSEENRVITKNTKRYLMITILFLLSSFASATITFTGSITPSTAGSWNSGTQGYIAGTADYQTGTVTMTASTDTLAALGLYVGNHAGSIGTLTMSGGSTMTITGDLYLARGGTSETTGSGTVNLSGAGTNLTCAVAAIGRYGTGAMYIHDGAQLETGDAYMQLGTAASCNAILHVDGYGSNVTTTGYLSIGRGGATGAPEKATVEIFDGGSINIGTVGYIGYAADSNASVTVDGDGSTFSTEDDLEVARYGNGKLIITNNGLVKVGGVLSLNLYGSAENGEIRMSSGSRLAIKDSGNVGNSSIDAFIDLIEGSSQDIKSWNGSSYVSISNATEGVDYTIEPGMDDLLGYTVLKMTEMGKRNITGDATLFPWFSNVNSSVGINGTGSLYMGDGCELATCYTTFGYYGDANGIGIIEGEDTQLTADFVRIGYEGQGLLTIRDGAIVESHGYVNLAHNTSTSVGTVTVDGTGSKLLSDSYYLVVGRYGYGYLNILNGGEVDANGICYINYGSGSYGEVLVSGPDSLLSTTTHLVVSRRGNSSHLKITNGGMVKVGGALSMNLYGASDDGYIYMSNAGMLALYGNGSASITAFRNLIDDNGPDDDGSGTDDILYWNGSSWSSISGGAGGADYTLQYYSSGDLAGYTVLTVLTEDEDACMYELAGDLNDDCVVNSMDQALYMANEWLDCRYPIDFGTTSGCE